MSTATSLPLNILMNRHGTDKLWLHHYDADYAWHFDPLRDKPVKLLEIGIGGYKAAKRGGESLKVWRDYFPLGRITGIDIEDKRWLCEERITALVCDQSKPEQLLELNEKWGPWDIIIDDGSHMQSHILLSFETLFPCLNRGGIYVIEDMATAYHPEYGGEGSGGPLVPPRTSITLLSELINGLNWHFWSKGIPNETQKMVKSIHVSTEIAFIYKR